MLKYNPQINLDSNTYIARQAILDVDGHLFGYELLYRNSMSNCYPKGVTDTEATARMYAEHFLGEIAGVLGDTPAFINFDYDSLVNGSALDFNPDSIVIEVLESCTPTNELFELLQDLKSKGYTLALDDFTPSKDWRKFYPLVDIIKFDIQNMSITKCGMYIKSLKEYEIRFLAEKVESYEEYEFAKRCGFDLFQGYYFTKPKVIKSARLSSSTQTLLNLSKLIISPPLNYEAINSVIVQSPSLSYQLLRYVNHSGLVGEITSVRQALAYLGDTRITRYCSYALLSQLGSDKPPILQLFALKRARFMYLVFMHVNYVKEAEHAYLVGLFSLIDAMLDMSIDELGESLNLDPIISEALIQRSGCIGKVLRLCTMIETNDWEAISGLSSELELTENEIIALTVESDLWVTEVL